MPRKVKDLNLDLERITLKELESILGKVEDEVKKYLKDKLPPRTEYDIVMSIENREGSITLSIDIGIKGGYTDIIDYNKVIGDAINAARRVFEKELSRYRKS